MLKSINSENAPKAVGPYSQAVSFGDFIFISGQLHINPDTGELLRDASIEDKTKLIMDNIRNILKEEKLDFYNVAKTTIYVKNLDDFSKINEVYGSYFGGVLPARETVEVSKLPLDGDVEISVIAVR